MSIQKISFTHGDFGHNEAVSWAPDGENNVNNTLFFNRLCASYTGHTMQWIFANILGYICSTIILLKMIKNIFSKEGHTDLVVLSAYLRHITLNPESTLRANLRMHQRATIFFLFKRCSWRTNLWHSMEVCFGWIA